jgi:hypothetical protein
MVGVEARARSCAARFRSAVAQMHRDCVIGMSRLNPDRAGHFAASYFELNHVHAGEAFALGHLGADQDGIVPSQLRHRLRQFLQPAIVRELAVVDRGIAAEIDFEASAL